MASTSDPSDKKGVKLPYFHRTLSPADAALIGDITPKPITDVKKVEVVECSSSQSGSAWNAAMTWEEKDCTNWAKDKLPGLFDIDEQLSHTGEYTVTLSSCSGIDGHANITHVRGKARFMYEFSFDLKFSIKVPGGAEYTGTAKIVDVINDQLDDIDVSLSWTVSPPGAILIPLRNTITSGTAMKTYIKQKMAKFEEDFRNRVL